MQSAGPALERLLLRRGGESRAAALAAGALLSAAGVATRWSVFTAAFESASDPAYLVGPAARTARARDPIAYLAVEDGTPVYDPNGSRVGVVEHVMAYIRATPG